MKLPVILTIMCALLVGACATGPEARGIEVTDDHKIYNQEKAMFTLEYMVNDHYGKDITDLQFDSKVYWTDTPCPYKDGWAVVQDGVCYFGKMWSCGEMYVAKNMNSPNNTCKTALLHEFGHCIRQELNMPTHDGDHWDDEFWAIVAEANLASCDRGWVARDILEEMDHMIEQHNVEYDYSIYLEE